MRLQQATTFKELMREFVALFQVTGRAGKHKVPFIVRAATGHRYKVINMVDVLDNTLDYNLLKRRLAIVTKVLLPYQLISNILSGMFPSIMVNTRFTVTIINTPFHAMSRGILLIILFMFYVVFSAIQSIPPSLICTPLLSMGRFIFSAISTPFLNMINIILGVTLASTFLAICSKPIFTPSSSMEKLRSKGLNFLTLYTSLVSFRDRNHNFGGIFAHFAKRMQSILFASIASEKLMSCRKELLAPIALLFGDIKGIFHILNHLCLVTLFLVVARVVRCPTFSQGVITPSLGNMSTIPFFAAHAKAAV